jgi:multisubunit Na+/H+ antiporter MnhB subunit
MGRTQQVLALVMVAAVGLLLVSAVTFTIPAFGSFPQRKIGERIENAIGQQILENAPRQTGAANVVTSVVWGYRGYDTLGEATVLFTAVVGVMMVFRAARRSE